MLYDKIIMEIMAKFIILTFVTILCGNINSFAQSMNDTVFVSFVNNGKEKILNSNFEIYILGEEEDSLYFLDIKIENNYFTYNDSDDLSYKSILFKYKGKLYYFGNTFDTRFSSIDTWDFIHIDNPDDIELPRKEEKYDFPVHFISEIHIPGRHTVGVIVEDKYLKGYREYLKKVKKLIKNRKK